MLNYVISTCLSKYNFGFFFSTVFLLSNKYAGSHFMWKTTNSCVSLITLDYIRNRPITVMQFKDKDQGEGRLQSGRKVCSRKIFSYWFFFIFPRNSVWLWLPLKSISFDVHVFLCWQQIRSHYEMWEISYRTDAMYIMLVT